MKYLLGILFPLLVQCLVVFVVIEANTGNGSWLGLGAFLIGIFTIPATAIFNFVYIRTKLKDNDWMVIAKCNGFAVLAPFVIILMLAFG